MKNIIQISMLISIILSSNCSKDNDNDKRQEAIGESVIEITYINNEGFIIISREKKIIIDGLLSFNVSQENKKDGKSRATIQ